LVTALGIAFGLELKSPLVRNVNVYVVPPPGSELIVKPGGIYPNNDVSDLDCDVIRVIFTS
jgi:hypothetical protein